MNYIYYTPELQLPHHPRTIDEHFQTIRRDLVTGFVCRFVNSLMLLIFQGALTAHVFLKSKDQRDEIINSSIQLTVVGYIFLSCDMYKFMLKQKALDQGYRKVSRPRILQCSLLIFRVTELALLCWMTIRAIDHLNLPLFHSQIFAMASIFRGLISMSGAYEDHKFLAQIRQLRILREPGLS